MLNSTCLHQVLSGRNKTCPQSLIPQDLRHKLYKKSLSSSGKRFGSAHYKSWAKNAIGQAPFRAYTNEIESRNIEYYLAEDTEIYPSSGKFNVVNDGGTISPIRISSLGRSKNDSLANSTSSLSNGRYVGGVAIFMNSFTDGNIFHQFYFSGIPFAASYYSEVPQRTIIPAESNRESVIRGVMDSELSGRVK